MGKTKFTTTIDESILEEIKILAVKEKRSVSAILEELIREYIKNSKEGN